MVIAEPGQNGRGALVPPDGYWPELRRICDMYGVLLCADEVINGFGRLGAWFGSEVFGVVPDLLTFAKGVTSAYAPLGGVIATNKVVDEIAASSLASFVHGSTFGGHPVATAVAVANLMAMREERVVENVVAHRDHLANRMRELHDTYDVVKEVRGMGYFTRSSSWRAAPPDVSSRPSSRPASWAASSPDSSARPPSTSAPTTAARRCSPSPRP
jgi:adenosylmethionine-8-amino-7-oxononanoate aminotransferase